jgi:uncharacterized protein YbcI
MLTADLANKQDILFFFGAGASVKAGVPDTFGLVNKFKETIASNPYELKAVEKILEILTLWKKEQGKDAPEVDVELLLETLERLETKDQDILIKFHTITDYALSGYVAKNPLKDQLKDLIKSVGVVKASNVRYLEPLLGFIEESKPLDVFSVNYDTAVEQFCNVYKREYVDGFDLYWNRKSFERTDVDIRLFKLHGSILWYRTDRGYYVKLPTKIEKATTELITGEKAVSLILYPIRKWDYAEPLLELLLKLKEKLEVAKFAIVVGYSFRDDHIKRIFWDAARTNKDLVMIFISPNSNEIYENKLKDYEIPELPHSFSSDFEPEDFDACFPSSLSGRVICLPHRFEDVLSYLKNLYLKELKSGIVNEKDDKEKENRGETGFWYNCLRSYANCEHIDKVAEVSEKLNWIQVLTDRIEFSVEVCFKVVLSYFALGRETESNEWRGRLKSALELLSVDNLSLELVSSKPFRFRLSFHPRKQSIINFSTILTALTEVIEAVKRKRTLVKKERAQVIETLYKNLELFIRYLSLFQVEIDLNQYLEMKKDRRQAKWFEEKTHEFEVATSEGEKQILEQIKQAILVNERSELERIFGGYAFQLTI